MRRLLRSMVDKLFTSLSLGAVLLMAAALLILLGPVFLRGSRAVVFHATVEYRRMLLGEFHRGDVNEIAREYALAVEARRPVYEILDRFARGIDTSYQADQVKTVYRAFREQMSNRVESGALPAADARELQSQVRRLRDALLGAYAATNKAEALVLLDDVLAARSVPALRDSVANQLFTLADDYRQVLDDVDLARRADHLANFQEVRDILKELLGPRPGRAEAELAEFRYGATRWDRAEVLLDRLLYDDAWVPVPGQATLVQKRIPRAELFEGTAMAKLFPLVEENLPAMLRPEFTIYWRYFIDPATPGNLYGGVGKEVLGTLLLAGLAMLFAVPVGLITAAFLVECTRDSLVIRVIRTCINTLAGVPSIVFGLFGLAFFVMWFLPRFGLQRQSSILAGGLTLGLLVLPIMIRTSEEAIKSVPRTYKEASLALGAGGLRTFLQVTLPAALPGVLTGCILSLSRAAGETAPILFTAAVAFGDWPSGLGSGTQALPYSGFMYATADYLSMKAPHNQYGMIMTLILLVLVLNVAAIVLRSRVARKLRGQ